MKNKFMTLFLLLGLVGLGACSDQLASGQTPDSNLQQPDPLKPLVVENPDLGPVAINNDAVSFVKVSNTSATKKIEQIRLEGLSYPFDFQGGTYPGTDGNCPADGTLKPGQTCKIAISIAAQSSSGLVKRPISLSYEVAGQNVKQDFELSATAAALVSQELQANNINFVGVMVGQTKSETLVLKNTNTRDSAENIQITASSPNSLFVIKNSNNCPSIAANSSCSIEIQYTPSKATPGVIEYLDLSYRLGSDSKTAKIKIDASAVLPANAERISIEGQKFGTIKIQQGQIAAITLVISNEAGPDISNLRIDSPTGSNFQVDLNASTCLPTYNLKAGGPPCILVLSHQASASKSYNEARTLSYSVNNQAKSVPLDLSGHVTVDPRPPALLEVSGENFGTLNLAKGERGTITLTVTNPPGGSRASLLLLGNILQAQELSEGFNSTCRFSSLDAGQSCTYEILVKPKSSSANYQKTLELTYLADGALDIQKVSFDLRGSINLSATAGVEITGQDFGSSIIALGDKIEVTLRITNPLGGSNVTVDTLQPLGSWGIAAINAAQSTCTRNKILSGGASCVYKINLSPTQSLIPYSQGLQFKFLKSTGQPDSIMVFLQGSINLQNAPVTPQLGAQPQLVANPGNEWFAYKKRPLKSTAPVASIPGLPYTPPGVSAQFPGPANTVVQWTFPNPQRNIKLKDIVVDRIDDPATGKKYIPLYHGTTSDLTNIFKQGANIIDFAAVKVDAYGKGFYMTANTNEAKAYGCDRAKTKNWNQPGHRALLLVIGVEELDKIQGVASNNVKETFSNPATGDSNDRDNIFFRKNTENQFVFFSNVKPYLKIFQVVDLPTKYGMASSIFESYGLGIDDNKPGNDPSYQCSY